MSFIVRSSFLSFLCVVVLSIKGMERVKKADSCTVREPVYLMPVLANGVLPCPCRDDYTFSEVKGIINTNLARSAPTVTKGELENEFFNVIHILQQLHTIVVDGNHSYYSTDILDIFSRGTWREYTSRNSEFKSVT